MEDTERVRISPAAVEKMKSLAVDGQYFKINMINSCWSGPEFRLVQTDTISSEDLAYQEGDITVYLDPNDLPFIAILDIGLFEAYGEEMLLVEENLI